MCLRSFILLLASCNVLSNPPSIDEAFKSFSIVPTTISSAPESLLSIRFGKRLAKLGNYFEPHEVAFPPILSFEAKSSELYTILILDLFEPSLLAPKAAPYLFMLIVNIPGCDVIAGDVVSPYVPPNPIPGTGYHPYVYLVYKQPCRIDTNAKKLFEQSTDYTTFSLPEFTATYNLSNPVAGNFFISRASICNSQPPAKLSKCN